MSVPGNKLPAVLSERRDIDSVHLQLRLAPQLPCFDGHFPGFPVLPGVVQIHWAMLFGRDRLGVSGVFQSMQQIKFNDIVEPGADLALALRWDGAQRRLHFDYRADGRKASSGRIQLA